MSRHLGGLATTHQLSACGHTRLNQAHDFVAVSGADERTHFGLRVHRVTHAQLFGARLEAGQKAIGDRTVNEDPGAVGAHLALGVEVAHHGRGHRLLHIGVFKHDQGRFAAELHGHAFERVGRGVHHPLARGHRTGDRHLGHTGMRGQGSAGGARALHDVEHARGQTRFGVNLGQFQRRHGGEFGGLEHHGVARGQRRGGLPASDLNGVVPSTDAGTHAQRLAPGVGKCVLQRDVLTIERSRGTGKKVQAIGPAGHVHHQGFLQRFARVHHLQAGQFIVARDQQIGRSAQDLAAFCRGRL